MIAVVTDSSAQLPRDAARRAGIAIVPLTILFGVEEFLEGVDLDPDAFYERLDAGDVATTSLPSPGRFRELYDQLLARPVDEIVSVHVASTVSGTVDAARIAAADAPVEVVDSRQVSYGVAVCALEAARIAGGGGSALDAADAVAALTPHIGNAFVAARSRSGKVAAGESDAHEHILTFDHGAATALDAVSSRDVVHAIAEQPLSGDAPVEVAVGASDPGTFARAEELAVLLSAARQVVAVHRYRVGPSVGAHTGAGTYGVVWWPAPDIRGDA